MTRKVATCREAEQLSPLIETMTTASSDTFRSVERISWSWHRLESADIVKHRLWVIKQEKFPRHC